MNKSILLLLFLGTLLFGFSKWKGQTDLRQADEVYLVPSVESVRLMSLGHHQAAAAVLWMQSLVEYGGSLMGGNSGKWVLHRLDLVTRLDSTFKPAYLMIATSQSDPSSKDLETLERGIRAFPRDWQLSLMTALKYIDQKQDFGRASQIMAAFAQDTSAPPYIRSVHKTMALRTMPIEVAILELVKQYLSEDQLFHRATENKLAVLLFYPNSKFGIKATEDQKQKIRRVLEDLKAERMSPQLGLSILRDYAMASRLPKS